MTDGAEAREPLVPEPAAAATPGAPDAAAAADAEGTADAAAEAVAATAAAAVAGDPPALPTDPGDVALLGLVDRLAALLERSELTELEAQVGGTGLVLRTPSAVAPAVAPAAVAVGAGAAGAGGAGEASGAAAPAVPSRPSVKAPLTGIWYGSPSPGTAPYVTVGGEVVAGQVVGLIEAMKLFNEIKSDLSGRVARIHAENGKLVKARQPLIEVDPL